jgi:hypothetical protein
VVSNPNISYFTHHYKRHPDFALYPGEYQPVGHINRGPYSFLEPRYEDFDMRNYFTADPNYLYFTLPANGRCAHCNAQSRARCEQCRACYCANGGCQMLTNHKYSCIKEIDHLDTNTVYTLWKYIQNQSDQVTQNIGPLITILSSQTAKHRLNLTVSGKLGLLELIYKMETFVRKQYMWNDHRIKLYIKILVNTYKNDWSTNQSKMFKFLEDRSLFIAMSDVLEICMKTLNYNVIGSIYKHYGVLLTADHIAYLTIESSEIMSLFKCLFAHYEASGELTTWLLPSIHPNLYQPKLNKFSQFMRKLDISQRHRYPTMYDERGEHLTIMEICMVLSQLNIIPDMIDYIIDLIAYWNMSVSMRLQLILSVNYSCIKILNAKNDIDD